MGNLDRLIDGARDFACELYRLQPKALIPNLPNDALRFAWDKMCGEPPKSPSNLPPPPAVPFQGGQCVCVVYIVEIKMPDDYIAGNILYGPIGGIRTVRLPRDRYNEDYIVEALSRGTYDNGYSPCLSSSVWAMVANFPKMPIGLPDATLHGIRTRDGVPDSCGNPPKDYPPSPPSPPGGFTSPSTPIVLNDNDTINVTFNLSPPTIKPPVNTIPPIVVNVSTPQFKIPISFEFDGNVGIGTPVSPPLLLPPDVVSTINNTNINTNNTNDTVNNINNIVNSIYPPLSLVNNPDVKEEEEEIEDGKEEEKGIGVLGLAVTLTTLPQKSQYGYPNVYFGGWIAFKRDGGYTPREQIFFETSFFLAPPGASGYTITLTNGAKGVVKVYSREQ